MHIKYVVVEGFRVYRDRIELAPLSPKHNVIGACATAQEPLSALRLPSVADRPDVPGSLLSVGANGSGKSNFFAGACRAHAEAAACVARRFATPERAAAAAEPERACVCASQRLSLCSAT